jgi:hypothetical protein
MPGQRNNAGGLHSPSRIERKDRSGIGVMDRYYGRAQVGIPELHPFEHYRDRHIQRRGE